jgi:hypothetical protein
MDDSTPGGSAVEETRREDEGTGPNVPATVVVGVVGALLLFLLVVLLQALYFRAEERERRTKVVAVPSEELTQLRSEQEALLGSYRWIDRGAGVVGIPIERAMELEAAGR